MPKKKVDYKKIVLFWVIVFLVGGLSGVFFNRVLIPWLVNFAPFSGIIWLDGVKDNTTIINKTEKVYISQETAFQGAIARVGNSVVAVRVERTGHQPIANSGFILTGDGLIVTANFNLAPTAKILVLRGDKEYEARLLKQDAANNLALLKIEANDLSVADFGDSNNLRLGEEVFLTGAAKINNNFVRFANLGFVKTVSPDPSLTFTESSLADGAPLGNIEGKVLGLVLVDKQGKIKVVGVERIKTLLQ
ncbi:MAG: Protease do [Parcubacteria group bacterium GW2011_GWA2_43_9b]|uniref:Serine protease n=1 Tax=Candidatus Portnoybacteria bacterium RIFCSPLOWO2_02_FULL_39_11 TaxID=1802001 RepID=A0A1G2FQA3_9BACT|nr:MAG: Protease do [Parcubacteria group bacterium GW2011_GWA2_43_9b]OGZ39810.1 MAG: hypothetical protein A3B04_00125 [Candidatus Portnoybacteria bacterium RIFCSPLOWO2_02_FULL_39_11]